MSIRKVQTGLLSGLAILLVVAFASASFAATLASSTPAVVNTAQNLGPEDPSKVLNLTLWLQVRNQAALDDLTRQIYTKGSPNFRKFLTREQ